jgi:triphosphoribosyl-dephospho-CoA synthase
VNLAQGIAQAAQLACILEVASPKPGNVNRQHDFGDTRYEDFLLSAVSIGPAMQVAHRRGVGRTIWNAIRDTHRLVTSNTNLGIVLLIAPIAKACFPANGVKFDPPGAESYIHRIRRELSVILASLTVQDARFVYRAIRLAAPGGMGRSGEADIEQEPSITLLQAMQLAKDRDTIAREYVTGFEITFEIGYPAFKHAWESQNDPRMALVQAYLTVLANVPDTLIARKRGLEKARQVSCRAQAILEAGGIFSAEGRQAIAAFDLELRDANHSLNPGTTADLITAAAFLLLLERFHSQTLSPFFPQAGSR